MHFSGSGPLLIHLLRRLEYTNFYIMLKCVIVAILLPMYVLTVWVIVID